MCGRLILIRVTVKEIEMSNLLFFSLKSFSLKSTYVLLEILAFIFQEELDDAVGFSKVIKLISDSVSDFLREQIKRVEVL